MADANVVKTDRGLLETWALGAGRTGLSFKGVIGGTLVKVLSWYDNEWGFSNRMLDTTLALINAR